jgi:hypothetical protein
VVGHPNLIADVDRDQANPFTPAILSILETGSLSVKYMAYAFSNFLVS